MALLTLILVSTFVVVGLYLVFVHYPRLSVVTNEIAIHKTGTALKLAVISDLERVTPSKTGRIVQKIDSHGADAILLLGDIGNPSGLANLKNKTAYAVLGNGDYKTSTLFEIVGIQRQDKPNAEKISNELANMGITTLRNESADLDKIRIIGLDNYTDANLNRHIRKSDKFTIVMAHTQKNLTVNKQADLWLFGHLHGFDKMPVASPLIHKFLKTAPDNHKMHTTSGLGAPRYGPPEIVILNLSP